MGITTETLHFYGVAKETLSVLLSSQELLRENNAPWLSVLPAAGAVHPDRLRMEKLAKQITKADNAAAALLFNYFDDELFSFRLFRNGRAVAHCGSSDSWAKFGKQLDLLFGDGQAIKASRYASRCITLKERLALLEETVGTALLDIPEAEPRTVPRNDNTLRAIKAREAALRKRPDQFVLTEIDMEDWPEDFRAQYALYTLLRPQWRQYDASELLFRFGDSSHSIPYHWQFAVHAFHDRARQDHLICYQLGADTVLEQGIPAAQPCTPLWMTKQGELVYLFLHYLWMKGESDNWTCRAGRGFAACLGADGSVRWSFAPALQECQILKHVHTSADGIITLCVQSGRSGDSRLAAVLYRIDGETGRLLHSRTIPAADQLETLVRVDALDGFAYASESAELVLLDDSLKETARWKGFRDSTYLRQENVVGSFVWQQGVWDRAVRRYDLRTGMMTEICPEIPVAYVLSVLPDGRILGLNDKQTLLTVFDPVGKVVARLSVGGVLCRVRTEPERTCILEIRAPETYGFVSDELFDASSIHLWRLNPA